MSGSIQRPNTCSNCAYMEAQVGPQGRRQLICRYEPPVGHPVVTIMPSEDGKSVTPQLLGTITVWPEVEVQTWCGRHSINRIEQVREVPKQMQTFGGLR